ncbi:MAG: protein kinase domain-containing protein [Planctomycetota bacterium]
MSNPDRLLKSTLGGCEILEVIGKGGMGIIYRARQISLDRIVAVKVLSPKISDDATFVQRFQREARAIARVSHPNVLQVYDVGCENEIHFMTMELVDGGNLSELQSRQGVLSAVDGAEFIIQAASGLEAAQQAGIIHRDIKPDNLMLTKKGIIKVSDFGLARDAESAKSVTDAVMGTPAYMSPEQCDGKAIDGRCDIYSLGGTFFKLVTGRLPFEAETAMSMMYRHKHEPLTPPAALIPTIPQNVSDIIVKMMAKQRQDRFQTMGEVVEELKRVCEAIRRGGGNKVEETLVFNRGIDDSAPTMLPKRGTSIATGGLRGEDPGAPPHRPTSARRPGTAGPYTAISGRSAPNSPPPASPGGHTHSERRQRVTPGPGTAALPQLRGSTGMFSRGPNRQSTPLPPQPPPSQDLLQPPGAHPLGIPVGEDYPIAASDQPAFDAPEQRALLDIHAGHEFFATGDLVAAANCFNRAIYSNVLSESEAEKLQTFMHEQYETFLGHASEFAGQLRFLEAIKEYRLAALYNPADQNILQYIADVESKINLKREGEAALKAALNRRDYARVAEIVDTVPPELLDSSLHQDIDTVLQTKLPALRHVQTARKAAQAGMLLEANEAYLRAMEFDPQNQEYRLELEELKRGLSRFDGFFRSGQERLNKGDTRRAIDDLKVAVQAYPKHPAAVRMLAAAQFQLGLSEAVKDPLRAQARLKEALQNDPSNQEAQAKLEEVRGRLEKEQALIRAASEASRRGKFGHAAALWAEVQQYNPANNLAATELAKARRLSRRSLVKLVVATVVLALLGFAGYRYYDESTRLEEVENDLQHIDRRTDPKAPVVKDAQAILQDQSSFLFNRARAQLLQTRLAAKLEFLQALSLTRATPPDWAGAHDCAKEAADRLDSIIAAEHQPEDSADHDEWLAEANQFEVRLLVDKAHAAEQASDTAADQNPADFSAGLKDLDAARDTLRQAADLAPGNLVLSAEVKMIENIDVAVSQWSQGARNDVAKSLAAARAAAAKQPLPHVWTKLDGALNKSTSQLETLAADYAAAARKAAASQSASDLQIAIDALDAYLTVARKIAPEKVPPAEQMQGFLQDSLRCWKDNMALMNPGGSIVDPAHPVDWGDKDRPEAFCIDRYEYSDHPNEPPRVGLSFNEARALCQLHGKDLCKQSQWEAACEFNDPVANKYFVGANYPADNKDLPCNTESGVLRPSGTQATCRNKLGVYDMVGNAEEWVVAFGQKPVLAGGGATSWAPAGQRGMADTCHSENPTPDDFLQQAGVRCCVLLNHLDK